VISAARAVESGHDSRRTKRTCRFRYFDSVYFCDAAKCPGRTRVGDRDSSVCCGRLFLLVSKATVDMTTEHHSRLTRRRWFQFGLGQFLLLATLLRVLWWQAALWPVHEIRKGQEYLSPKPVFEISEIDRPPTPLETIKRGTVISGAVLGSSMTIAFLILRRWFRFMRT
jgi:hypothetical protein